MLDFAEGGANQTAASQNIKIFHIILVKTNIKSILKHCKSLRQINYTRKFTKSIQTFLCLNIIDHTYFFFYFFFFFIYLFLSSNILFCFLIIRYFLLLLAYFVFRYIFLDNSIFYALRCGHSFLADTSFEDLILSCIATYFSTGRLAYYFILSLL